MLPIDRYPPGLPPTLFSAELLAEAAMPGASEIPPNYFEAADTVEAVIRALKQRAPALLKNLRDLPGEDDEAAAHAWAKSHGLNSPVLLYCLAEQRRWWRARHDKGAQLEIGGGWEAPVTIRVPSPPEEAWVQENTTSRNLPNPSTETLTAWLKRARALYKQRAKFQRLSTRKRQLAVTFSRRADWWLRMQLGETAAGIARSDRVDTAAVIRGANVVTGVLGLSRPRRLGRPRKSPRQL